MIDLQTLIGRDVPLKRKSCTHGGELAGPCNVCRRGKGRPNGRDHLVVWPHAPNGPGQPPGRWACLGPKAGRSGCDIGGDAIQYLRERDGLSYRDACTQLGLLPTGGAPAAPHAAAAPHAPPPLAPPNPLWQAHANGHAARCAALLWSDAGARARAWLHRRGLFDPVLRAFDVGYNPHDAWEEHAAWGLTPRAPGAGGRGRHIWLPRGITFPWYVDGGLWRLNIRRPLTRAEIAGGETKYIGPAGFANALYNGSALAARLGAVRPVVLVEGEIDALTIVQACGEDVAAVATGSTGGGRRGPWVARLALAPLVLVAFDADRAGDGAAQWWLDILPQAHRWRPLDHDVNTLPDPATVRAWVMQGLNR
jgi:hypothetical protein